MKSVRSFKKQLGDVYRLWQEDRIDEAVSKTEELQQSWPGNTRLRILWATLIQLQESPTHTLAEVKKALQDAAEMEDPAAACELGHYLDSVEDDPKAAAKAYTQAIASARQLLGEALLGKARTLLQLNKKPEAAEYLAEAIQLTNVESQTRNGSPARKNPYVLVDDSNKSISTHRLQGPFAAEIEELLKEVQ